MDDRLTGLEDHLHVNVPGSGWRGELRDVVPVIPTPFDLDEDVDLDALRVLIDFAANSQMSAVCIPAYGSEFYKLTSIEKSSLITLAVEQADQRIGVVAQSNHGSARIAADIARQNEDFGADVISFALPRQFPLREADLLRYSERVCKAVHVPVMVQDFNPGGTTVGAQFARRLHESAPNFCYLKLEQSLMATTVQEILEETHGGVQVLSGWGGMHLLELLPAGIAGVVPGLAVCDLLQQVVMCYRNRNAAEASRLFNIVLPHIVYGLQNLELFHHSEKALLVKRGLLPSATVREPSLTIDDVTREYMDLTHSYILEALEQEAGAG